VLAHLSTGTVFCLRLVCRRAVQARIYFWPASLYLRALDWPLAIMVNLLLACSADLVCVNGDGATDYSIGASFGWFLVPWYVALQKIVIPRGGVFSQFYTTWPHRLHTQKLPARSVIVVPRRTVLRAQWGQNQRHRLTGFTESELHGHSELAGGPVEESYLLDAQSWSPREVFGSGFCKGFSLQWVFQSIHMFVSTSSGIVSLLLKEGICASLVQCHLKMSF
jgi:hypothetical protein